MENDRLKSLNDGGYNNLLFVVLALGAVYLFVSGFNKSKKQTYLETAGTDKNTQLAQALRDAFNRSGISVMMSVDGTDIDLVMQTAQQITDYAAVSSSYRVLYGSELTLDLQSELSRTDLQRFWDYVYRRNGSTPANNSLVGKSVTAKETVNIRPFEKPTNVARQVKAGQLIGTYLSETDLTIAGKKGRFVVVKESHILDSIYDVKVYVLKDSVKIG